jgi:hypothetical protein
MTRPFVIVISDTPLLAEALGWTFEPNAAVQRFSSNRGDLRALLRWAAADGAIVDDAAVARKIEPAARAAGLPVVHIGDGEVVRLLRQHRWDEYDAGPDVLACVRRLLLDEIDARRRTKDEATESTALPPPLQGGERPALGLVPRGERR